MIVRGLFEAGVSVAQMDPRRASVALYPEERLAVASAVDSRIREFSAGRQCARHAMEVLAFPPVSIAQRPDRAPSWPEGLVGSISHTDRLCAAAVARRSDGYEALGIDLEPAQPMPQDLCRSVCRTEELEWLDGLPSVDRGLSARAIFSAKETVFKLQYAISGAMLEFEDLSIAIDWRATRFVALFMTDSASPFGAGDEIEGRFALGQGHIACGAALTTQAANSRRSSRSCDAPNHSGESRPLIGADE